MTNTPYGVVTKVATLIPIVAAIYFFDILNWWGALLSSSSILTFVVLTASLFALGVILTLSLFLLLFLKFLNFQLKSMVLPTYMVVIGFAAWYHPALTSSLRTAFLIPELMLVLAIPRLRDFFLLPPNTLAKCDEHHV